MSRTAATTAPLIFSKFQVLISISVILPRCEDFWRTLESSFPLPEDLRWGDGVTDCRRIWLTGAAWGVKKCYSPPSSAPAAHGHRRSVGPKPPTPCDARR